MRQKRKKNREYLRIFMLFFTFFFIFLLVSALTYVRSSQNTREKLEQEGVEALNSSEEEWERTVRRIYESGYRMLNNEAFSRYIPSQGKEGNAREARELIDWMKIYGDSISEYGAEVFLYYDTEYVITPQGMNDFSMYFDVVRQHEIYTGESWGAFLKENQAAYEMKPDQVVEKYSGMNSKKVLPIVISKKVNGRQAVLGTEIPAEKIGEIFQRRCTLKGQEILCIDQEGNLFFDRGERLLLAEDIENIRNLLVKGPMGMENLRLDGKTYQITAKQGAMGLEFFLLTPRDSLQEAVFRSNGSMLFFFLTTMVLFFILTIIYTRRIYHPLRSVAQKLSEGNAADFQGNIQEAVDRFWVKNTSLLNKQEKLLSQSFEEGVRTLLRGGTWEEAMLLEYLEGADIRTDCMGCLILQMDFREKYYYDFSAEEQRLIEKNMPMILYQMLEGQWGRCIVPDLGRRWICFFTYQENTEEYLKEMMEAVCLLFSYDEDYCEIHSGVCGKAAAESGDVSRMIMEAATALRLQQEVNSVKPKEYEPEMANFNLTFSQKERNQLQNLLSAGQIQKAMDLADKILKVNEEAGVYEGLMQVLYVQLYQAGYEVLLSAAGENREKGEQLWSRVMALGQRHERGEKTRLKEFYGVCGAAVRQEREPDDILEKVFAYITAHFSEGIYLESAAEAASISPKYLSRIFKERTGVNISEYISLVRITKAKEMLTSTQMNVGEIGELVGFENRSTFFRTFKKLEGVSPSEYRRGAG